jgi:ribosomal protein S18 acetylase RimI-like enzyme
MSKPPVSVRTPAEERHGLTRDPDNIIEATGRDALSIACIQQTASAAAYASYLCEDYLKPETIQKRMRVWSETIGSPGDHIHVSLKEGTPVGYIHFRSELPDQPEAAELSSLYILPGFMRQGRGRALVEFCHDHLRLMQKSCVLLWVLECNRPAIAFYRAMGYTVSGTSKSHRSGHKAIQMQRDLAKL